MTDENPYRYEGSLEPAVVPESCNPITIAQVIWICSKGIFVAVIAGVAIGIFFDPEVVGAVLILSLFMLIPVAGFGITLFYKRKAFSAQLGFWFAAIPLAILFVTLLYDNGGDAGVVRDIGRIALIGYAIQLVPASLALQLFTIKELVKSDNGDNSLA